MTTAKADFINQRDTVMSLPELDQINERLLRIEGLLIASKSILNMREAAIFTGLSTSHLYKLTSTGGIPCYKPAGKTLYFNREELETWLLRGRKATNEEIEMAATAYIAMNRR